ncbi:restriction endonuclease [Phytomonospora sp. NPDC050363]|uniref:restriction endonuclease n=1 Tax=Phytomonospora sp. NPDC050363 TaxID=3155642 RepID=UPI0033C19BBA
MTTMWGVHNDQPQLNLVDNRFISIGWPVLGDLAALGGTREAVKARVAEAFPDWHPNKTALIAGMLWRFVRVLQPGDLVVYPHKPDSTLYFGRIAGDYAHLPGEAVHPNRRTVDWLPGGGVPRTAFSQAARYEIGSSLTLFEVKKHKAEFLRHLDGTVAPSASASPPAPASDEALTEAAAVIPDAERIETYTRDFVIETLMTRLEGVDFEHFVAHLLNAMGYRTQVTTASGDGGVDIIAHRDPLGLEPPIIKVQCKRTAGTIGGPDVRGLIGTLSSHGGELGLFVTLGAYSKDAQYESRARRDLRLVNGRELVDLVFEHYEKFSAEYKRLLPMRPVYVVDTPSEAV